MKENYISLSEASVITGHSVVTLRNWIKNGSIKAVRPGAKKLLVLIISEDVVFTEKAMEVSNGQKIH